MTNRTYHIIYKDKKWCVLRNDKDKIENNSQYDSPSETTKFVRGISEAHDVIVLHDEYGLICTNHRILNIDNLSILGIKSPNRMDRQGKCVFVNAPFDDLSLKRIVMPMLFTIIVNGYEPVLTFDNNNCSQLRLDKIFKLIKSSDLSIHDLSILGIDKTTKLARMNMPFELGIDYGLNIEKGKKIFVMGDSRYDYMKAISDLNGIDIANHSNNTLGVIGCVARFLNPKEIDKQPPLALYYAYIRFQTWLYVSLWSNHGSDVAIDYYNKPEIKNIIFKIKEWMNIC